MITFIESGNRIATENFEIGEIYTITYTNETIRTMCCIGIGSDFVMFQDKMPNALFCLTIGTAETVSSIDIGGGGGSTMNYNELENKPQINGIVLIGNKTSSDLGLLSQADLDNYVTDTELTTELTDYATKASVVSGLASKQDQLTTPQLTAVNSGITSSLVTQIETNTNAIAGKQDTLTTPQLTAVNSGITSSLVTQIGTNTTAIAGKQDRLTTSQLTAVNSGITRSLVTQIGTNTTAIAGKQDQLTTPQLTAVNSGITSSLVNQITTNKNNISTANAELIELVDNGAKNLFLPTAESKTNPTGFTGTITNNGDGSYTINGTAGSSPYYLKLGTINLKAGNYVLYARPTQQSGFYVYNDGAWTDSGVNDNRYATFATDTTQNIYLRVDSNATVSNYTIYPMICYKSAWDVSQKYVPYAMTNAEITAWIQAHT